MFERFTERARGALADAATLAKELKSPAIRRHHLLVALIDAADDGSGSVAAVLEDAGVEAGAFRAALIESLTGSETPLSEGANKVGFTMESKKALELSLREALSLGHNYIGREHLLLGVLRDPEGPLAAALGTTKLTHARAWQVVAQESPPSMRRGRRARGGPRAFRLGRRTTDGMQSVLRRTFERAQGRDATTGDLLVALLDTPGTHFAALLADVTMPDSAAAAAALNKLIADGVVDGSEDALRVDPEGASVTINDPDIVAQIKKLAGEGAVTPEKLREILKRLQSGD